MTVTILCAGALAPVGEQRAALPSTSAFARRLRRARIVARSRIDEAAPVELPDERWLRERFSLDGTLAACTLGSEGEGDSEDGGDDAPLVVRPVHLHLGLDHLVLAPPASAALDDDEARTLADAANRWLAEDGFELVPVRADAWRIDAHDADARATLAAFGALRAPSTRVASGRNVTRLQPQGEAAPRWRAFENLVQMAWFEHPLNERRVQEGRLPLSGLWLEGRAGSAAERAFEAVRTDDPAVAGLAHRAGSTVATFDAEVAPVAGTLIDAGFWKAPLAEGDADGWNEAWLAFERWFERGPAGVGTLRVVLTGERECVELDFRPADRFRPWRSLAREALLEHAA